MSVTAATAKGAADSASGPIYIIDADTHLSEPHDLWIKRAPAKLRARVPQVKELNGKRSWVIDEDKSIGDGAPPISAVYKDGTKALGLAYMTLTMEQVHPASSQTKARLEFMDQQHIWAHIIYPNVLGFGGQKTAKVDPELRLACVQIFNDAMAEMQVESGQRLFPMALLPWWDVKLAVQEVERTAKMGLRGINMNSDPHTARTGDPETLPDLTAPYWYPLWEICQEKNLPINFHIGGSEQSIDFFGNQAWPSLSKEFMGALGGTMMFLNSGRIAANLIYSGLLDRFTDLKFVNVESGIGWLPFLFESLDHQFNEVTEQKKLQMKPSEYFSRNFYSCFWFERKNLAHSIRAVGVDNVLFETDFPHPTCLYPHGDLTKALPGLAPDEVAKVLSLNAARVYSIPLPA